MKTMLMLIAVLEDDLASDDDADSDDNANNEMESGEE